jgi:hypothetical protein
MNDEFDFDGKPARPPSQPMQMWDVLSVFVLLLTACVAAYFVYIFITPDSPYNILPPGGRGPRQPTATVTPLGLQATWTPSPTLELTATDTPRPTFTPFFTNTPFSLIPPTRTPSPTATQRAPFTGSATRVESTVIHPDLACNWSGIGGTVVDSNNSHIIGTVVVLRGSLNGSRIEQQTVSGINKEYGPSGFEFVLGNAPVASEGELVLLLVDQQNIPLSEPVEITTSDACDENLVMVRFRRNR